VLSWLKNWLQTFRDWFRRSVPPPSELSQSVPDCPAESDPEPEIAPEPEPAALAALEPAPFPHRPGKWVKPKGVKPAPAPAAEGVLRRPRAPPKPKVEATSMAEDPEQYGQYYFRDAILDQLETYFIYLKRMKRQNKEAYELHRRLGIHILPQSAIRNFDKWRKDNEEAELSAWWKYNRPGFGAIAYGIDDEAIHEEKIWTADLSPEQYAALEKKHHWHDKDKPRPFNGRMMTMTGGKDFKTLDGETIKTGIVWVPKFLYFTKWTKVPSNVQKVVSGDVYSMTVHWDRMSGMSRTKHKQHKDGSAQDYAICVDGETGKVRLLKTFMHQQFTVVPKHGKTFQIPHNHWGFPTEYVSGASGRLDMPPEDYLVRVFMEAALLYENASLGSMVRITASKDRGKLVAAFGVDIKRMAYFFKDRDVTADLLTESGRRKPIFHITRPYTKKTGKAVPMYFSGLKEFTWAGYKISITVPGRDHMHLSDFDVGSLSLTEAELKKSGKKMLNTGQVGDFLNQMVKDGRGAWQK